MMGFILRAGQVTESPILTQVRPNVLSLKILTSQLISC